MILQTELHHEGLPSRSTVFAGRSNPCTINANAFLAFISNLLPCFFINIKNANFNAKRCKCPCGSFTKAGAAATASRLSVRQKRQSDDPAHKRLHIEEAFAAVTVPPSRLNAGFNWGILSGRALRGCSSAVISTSPLRVENDTGAISLEKLPFSSAFLSVFKRFKSITLLRAHFDQDQHESLPDEQALVPALRAKHCPLITSSTLEASMPASLTAALIAAPPSSEAVREANSPENQPLACRVTVYKGTRIIFATINAIGVSAKTVNSGFARNLQRERKQKLCIPPSFTIAFKRNSGLSSRKQQNRFFKGAVTQQYFFGNCGLGSRGFPSLTFNCI
ncbi:hypothetical protein GQR58_004433 [Nymphon striatum]|nr:hypothetical protein GQR58_004433 [Nymphon striatum]